MHEYVYHGIHVYMYVQRTPYVMSVPVIKTTLSLCPDMSHTTRAISDKYTPLYNLELPRKLLDILLIYKNMDKFHVIAIQLSPKGKTRKPDVELSNNSARNLTDVNTKRYRFIV